MIFLARSVKYSLLPLAGVALFRYTIDPSSLSVCLFVCLCVCLFVRFDTSKSKGISFSFICDDMWWHFLFTPTSFFYPDFFFNPTFFTLTFFTPFFLPPLFFYPDIFLPPLFFTLTFSYPHFFLPPIFFSTSSYLALAQPSIVPLAASSSP